MTALSVTLNDEQAQALLQRLADLVARPAGSLRQSAQALRRLVYDTFADETDPWGRRWARWAPSTRAARLRTGAQGRVLLRTGAMYSSIDARSDDEGVTVGASSEHAQYHQFGNPSHRAWGRKLSPLPQRAFLPLRSPGVADVPSSWWAEILLPVETAIARAAA